MILEKYSMGIGDRFGHQGKAQLDALAQAAGAGVDIMPVWNKSHREHSIIGTEPMDVRREADAAVDALGWKKSHYVDADHIGLKTVEGFVEASNFFTLDVADFIGEAPNPNDLAAFVAKYEGYVGKLDIPGLGGAVEVTREDLEAVGRKFLLAVQEAGRIYERIADLKGVGKFVTEVSMDESDAPQTPVEMFFILAAIAREGIPAQTIAPRFSGRFNKGVDYVGEPSAFAREFEQDLAVIAHAVSEFDLPENLKLSVHSGSDKFSIYGPIREALAKTGAGLHLKTAGTTWLEELIGLAHAGGEGLEIAREVYARALERFDELCKPYATVIDIDPAQLPSADEVNGWTGEQYADALRHDQSCKAYNPHLRQMLHVGYKVAAEMGARYLDALEACESDIAPHVTENLLDRHIRRVFIA